MKTIFGFLFIYSIVLSILCIGILLAWPALVRWICRRKARRDLHAAELILLAASNERWISPKAEARLRSELGLGPGIYPVRKPGMEKHVQDLLWFIRRKND